MFKKPRETFTEETMRKAKALTKAGPGFYKEAEKPKVDKIYGFYKQKAKFRIVMDPAIAMGKATPGHKYKTEDAKVSLNFLITLLDLLCCSIAQNVVPS